MKDELYIKMAEKAEEIQELWEPKEGDRVYHSFDFSKKTKNPRDACQAVHILVDEHQSNIYNPYFCPLVGIFSLASLKGLVTWLPTQEDLQEMVGGFEAGFVNWLGWLRNIYGWEYFYPSNRKYRFTSMNQLWLAFVYHENYGKYWTGADWEVTK